MGGQGSGRRPDVTKTLIASGQPKMSEGEILAIPNYSGIKTQSLKTKAETTFTDEVIFDYDPTLSSGTANTVQIQTAPNWATISGGSHNSLFIDTNPTGDDSSFIATNQRGIYIDIDDATSLTDALLEKSIIGAQIDVNKSGSLTSFTSLKLYGTYVNVASNLGTSNLTEKYGHFITMSGTADTHYGIYVSSIINASTNYAFYNDSAAHSLIGKDNVKAYFGTAADASIYYDGTHLRINPREVGVGNIFLEGGGSLTITNGNQSILADNKYYYCGAGNDATIGYDGTDLVINSAAVGSGVIKFNNASNWTANGTNTVTISNVAPAGVGTATIGKWFTVKDNAGTVYYIPAWT